MAELVPIPDAHYSNSAEVYLELGKSNAYLHADMEGNALPVEFDPHIEHALKMADDDVNLELKAHSPPPLTFPVTSTDAVETSIIRNAATLISAGHLLNLRWQRDGGTGDVRPGDWRITEGKAKLARLVAGGLTGVTLEAAGTDDLDSLRALSPVAGGLNECDCSNVRVTCPAYVMS